MSDVVKLRDASDVSIFGGKAANLAIMLQADLPVPEGYAVSLDGFADNGSLKDDSKEQLSTQLSPEKLYAVRSSALAEDAEGVSWAGLFETFLDVVPSDIIAKVEECHNSAKDRAKAYASEQAGDKPFEIAVVVQEMLNPVYAGVLFTKDPLSNEDRFVCEYVEGLGEELVSGRADPARLAWQPGEQVNAPFSVVELTELAQKAKQVFGSAQDIEWVWAQDKIWLVQARPITTSQTADRGYYLGEPDELFYWGPSRGKPLYASDYIAASEKFFIDMAHNPQLPTPPKALILFHEGRVVWLLQAAAFAAFTEATFSAYEQLNRLETDVREWESTVQRLDKAQADAAQLVEAWHYTLFAEFSLYGAETSISKRLARLEPKVRQDVWGSFTQPDKPTFLAAIDQELLKSKDPKAIADKYPWIEDGYGGVATNPLGYFTKRLALLRDTAGADPDRVKFVRKNRDQLAIALDLTDEEVNALNLARELAIFMDHRKAWMMRTRHYITQSATSVEFGWVFDEGKVILIDKKNTEELWQRYIDFKASSSAVEGIVASNGGRHFIHGEVRVVTSPTQTVPDGMVLVVPASSPSYVPLMRKAKAMITDHGGMMSHAAIVGREFNLPCIVGTKQGTKVLQDGDKVVLDLVTGEVQK